MTKELFQLLLSNPLFYYDEIKLIGENSALPPFVKDSVAVTKLEADTYGIHYSFFGRIIEYVLSFDNDAQTVKRYLSDGHPYDEAHTNLYIGDGGLTGKRNLYGGSGRNIVSVKKNPDLRFFKIAADKGEILSNLKEEIDRFESYEFVQQAIAGGEDFFAATDSEKCVGYLHTSTSYDPDVGMKIVAPNIYTARSERGKGIASELLAWAIGEYYRDFGIVYGVDPENIASNKLAQKIGLEFLGTKYRYFRIDSV